MCARLFSSHRWFGPQPAVRFSTTFLLKLFECCVGGGSYGPEVAIPQTPNRFQSIQQQIPETPSRFQGIPAYVELSNIFIALVSELSHKDSNLACSLGRRTQVFRALAWKEQPFSPSRALSYIPLCIPGLSFQQFIQYSEKHTQR